MENNDYESDYENEEYDSDVEESESTPIEQVSESSENIKPIKNKTFSYFQVREIENTNALLLKKVLAHNTRQKQYKTVNYVAPKKSSAEINRRKKQRQIDHDNLMLLKRIQSVKPFGLSKVK